MLQNFLFITKKNPKLAISEYVLIEFFSINSEILHHSYLSQIYEV